MTVLLRTLAWKSPLKFGQYLDSTVRMVFDLGLYEQVLLTWYYYNLSMISFSDEILTELRITPPLRIEKPGVDFRFYYKWRDATLTEEDRMFLGRKRMGQRNWIARADRANDNKRFTKSIMQTRNHGNS